MTQGNGHMQRTRHHDADFEGKSASEIQRELDSIRREMATTISQIERDLKPSQLIARAVDRIQEGSTAELGHNLTRTIVDNPIPVALVGVGLIWLAGASRRPGVEERGEGLREKARGRMDEVRAKSKGALDDVRARSKDTLEGMKSAMEGTSERAHHISARSREVARRGASRARHVWQEQPLLVGLLAVAAGAAIAGALPESRREREIVGPHRERFIEGSKTLASDVSAAVKEEMAGSPREGEAGIEGGTPEPTPRPPYTTH